MIIDTKKLQKEVLDNKRRHNFNTTDIKFELLLLYGEVNELFKGWLKSEARIIFFVSSMHTKKYFTYYQ
ncbi:hypothetical protein F5ESL0233_04205 [Lactobacillus sp. ESL0233]|nr:hypothetical protein F5ESL0233_04205 [Lactobacillus sp. ESL0233]